MRTKRTIINTAYSLGAALVLFVLGMVTQKLFLTNFDISMPGYSHTIEQLFRYFSVAEFGVGGVISYRLYECVAARDNEQISKYMSLYKWAYRVVGGVVAVLAVAVAPFLPLIFVNEREQMGSIYMVYILQALSTLSGYFLVTRRMLYTCTQQGYKCVRTDLLFNILNSLLRIAVAKCCPKLWLYLGVTVVCNTLANAVIAVRYKRDFPEVHDVRVSWKDFKSLGVFHDMRYYLVHRISNTIYGNSDDLVLTRMRGSAMVSLTTNYTKMASSVTDIGNKIMDSFAAAIGNIVYDREAEADGHARQVFWSMDLFSYFFGSFVAVAYFCLFQPFILLWMGDEKWLLPGAYVFFFSLNEYIGWNHRIIGSYRNVLGRFEEDQWYMVASGASNLILSFVLVWKFGLPGVVAATVFAHCLMWIGRARVVCRHYMKGCGGRYLRNQMVRAVTLLGEMALTSRLCGLLGNSLAGFVGKVCIVLVVPNALNLALYGWTGDAAYLRGRAKNMVTAVKAKLAARNRKPEE
ncbi:MAG: lipopolysaccharide biosynthesis protein [Gemmiger sp.]